MAPFLNRVALVAVVLAGLCAWAEPVNQFTVGAHEFDRGNVQVSLRGQQYATESPCIWNGYKYPNHAEYDIDFPVTADYTFHALYTAAASRPVDILLDGETMHTGLSSVTGSWSTDKAAWEQQCVLQITAGKHTIALERKDCIPHISAFRMVSSKPFPDGWELERAAALDTDWKKVTADFTINAHEFDEGNVKVSKSGDNYAKRYPCIWNAGELPNVAEYEIVFPVSADYTFYALYTAAASRPVDILLDGKKMHTGLANLTGDWNTDHAKWERQCRFSVTAGTHVIKLERQQCMPHICAFRMRSSKPFPDGWRLQRPRLAERRQREAKRARIKATLASLELIDSTAMRRAVRDLSTAFPGTFPDLAQALERIDAIERRKSAVRTALENEDEAALQSVAELQALQRELLLANPLVGADEILLVKRKAASPALGLPCNWQSNCALPRSGYDDEICRLSLSDLGRAPATLYHPDKPGFVGDVDLHFSGRRVLFSSIGTHNRWQVFEVNVDGTGLRQVTPGKYDDVDNYDACYLPDGRIIFSSTRTFASVPCVNGSTRSANLFVTEPDGTGTRLLCFDQEHNWCPTVMNDGRLLYTRWEYTDTPHTHSRLLFRMNPDGTQQMEYYGSNSYWPNSMFYTRPIPGHPTKVVTIVSGHHGVRRMGELVILDPAKGRHEADGVVQRIPGYGQTVPALIEDRLVDESWPKFLHPYPLGDEAQPDAAGKYFLVACQPSAQSLWGIYLVDVYDNLVLLREEPGYALLEPIPLRETPTPPVIPDKTDLARDDCIVQVTDIYRGPGLAGIPRGTVKTLRLFTYTYDYPGMGGPQGVVGMEGPWDVRRILGTVPVEEDGSVNFRAPANTPIALQPLDRDGAALQLMRSWLTGMPGEVVTCAGCHEPQNEATANIRVAAAQRAPREITPWHGPARGYGFQREVQPVLDKYCIACHNGDARQGAGSGLDLRSKVTIADYDSRYHHGRHDAGKFTVAYANLQRFVRRPGLESDFHMLTPMDFHVSTTQLYQMLGKGHHGVTLSPEAWDRLTTWIDLNAPYHGSWLTIAGEERVKKPAERRREMLKRYAGVDVDMEWTGPPLASLVNPVRPERTAPAPRQTPAIDGWPFDETEAKRRQLAAAPAPRRTVKVSADVDLSLVLIPSGKFVIGSNDGHRDEAPPGTVQANAFWMAQFEVTNALYAWFDPEHDSRVEVRHGMQFGVQGWPLNRPEQPAVRVSWHRAMAFCNWLSERTGEAFTLPTEAQWEYACRAGSDGCFSFGDADADFSTFANLADLKLRDAVSHPYRKENVPLAKPSKYDDWIPRDDRFNDGELVSSPVGKYQPNAWGLHDMHGNVWEWTLSAARPYPYAESDGRNDTSSEASRIARGGSWRDRPKRARASFRLAYRPYQRVYNVGFRVVCPVKR